MNIATSSPMQGVDPVLELIGIVDSLDELKADHAFLTTLYNVARDEPGIMDGDLFRLLTAYLDGEPRQRLQQASDGLMAIARKLPRQLE